MKTFKDVYSFPLKFTDIEFLDRVVDQDNNFVFQFTTFDEENNQKILDVINGKYNFKNPKLHFNHSNGYIRESSYGTTYILIRGWGNLTGTGAMRLSHEEAANIQDTFAGYIVNRLNERK